MGLTAAVLLAGLLPAGTRTWPARASSAAAVPTPPGKIAFTSTRNEDLFTLRLPVESGGAREASELVTDPAVDHQAAWSPNGAHVAFSGTRDDPAGDILVVDFTFDVDGVRHPARLRKLVGGPAADVEPSWAPDSKTIAFASNRANLASDATDIWTVRLDGSHMQQLTDDPAPEHEPAWSPDAHNQRIAFRSTRDNPAGDVYLVAAGGGPSTRLTRGLAVRSGPSWSRDLKHPMLAVESTRDERNGDIVSVDVDTGRIEPLFKSPAADSQPDWGTKAILFRSTRDDPNGDIYSVLPGNNPGSLARITNHPAEDSEPAWVDAETIVFTSTRRPFPQIWTMDSDGSHRVNVSRRLAHDASPAWSPDGRQIAFVRGPVERELTLAEPAGDIWVMNADGSGQRLLARGEGEDLLSGPAWSPDGEWIAFARGGAIWKVRAKDGGGSVAIPSRRFVPREPAWTPDDRILFTADHADGRDVARMGADGSNQIELTAKDVEATPDRGPLADQGPAWSPLEPRRIAFARGPTGGDEIAAALWLMDAGGQGQHRIMTPPAGSSDRDPAWSPGGELLAFSRLTFTSLSLSHILARVQERSLTSIGIWTVRPDGSQATDVTHTPVFQADFEPSWQPTVDLSVRKQPSATTVGVDRVFSYQLTVHNDGPASAAAVRLEDSVPPQLRVLGASWPAGTCTTAPAVRCELGTLPPKGTVVVTIRVQAATTAPTVRNTARVRGDLRDRNPANDTGGATVAIIGADVGVDKVDLADPVDLGQPIRYRITVINKGPDPAADVVVTDVLPKGLTATRLPPGCDGTATVVCRLGTMLPPNEAAAAPVQLELEVAPRAAGSYVNTVTVKTSTPQRKDALANDSAQATTEVVGATPAADLSVAATATPSPVFAGATLSYRLTVRNLGNAPASDVVLDDQLPAGLDGGQATVEASRGSCAAAATVHCQLGTVAPGAPPIVVDISATARGGPALTNTAAVSGSTPDVDQTNNRSAVTTKLQQPVVELSPGLLPPGFVAIATGRDFPPDADIELAWSPGMNPAGGHTTARSGADGSFTQQVLVFPNDQIGPRLLLVSGKGFGRLQVPLLVVPRSIVPPRFVRRG